jgi:hypothetical protein
MECQHLAAKSQLTGCLQATSRSITWCVQRVERRHLALDRLPRELLPVDAAMEQGE